MTRASLLASEVAEETAKRGVILPLCILCDSEAAKAMVDAGQQVTCPICQRYILAEGFAADLAEENDWPRFRSKLARAVRWQFYRNGRQPVKLRSATSAEWLVASLEIFEEDPEKRERAAVEAFVSAGPFEDIWDEPITKLSRALGRSREESRAFAEDLEARGIVRIITYETRQLEGATSFARTLLKQWVHWEERDSAKSDLAQPVGRKRGLNLSLANHHRRAAQRRLQPVLAHIQPVDGELQNWTKATWGNVE